MKILIWGGRSKARIIIEMIHELYADASIIGIFDKTLKELSFQSQVKLYSDKSGLDFLCQEATHFVVCIGGEHGYARFMTSEKLKQKGLKPLNLVSKHGLLDKLDYCGEGIQVMPGAIAHKFTSIGKQCILNTNSTVDHECKLGDGVQVMGGASIAGRVEIGDFSTVGTNATILPNITIGKNVFIGAGAVVIRDIQDNSVVAGIPAKHINDFSPSYDFSMFEEL
jgi:sugar O-acyltransferase (sialic acid O-acetyltransferase NeuD family)